MTRPVVLLVTIAGRCCAINGMRTTDPREASEPIRNLLWRERGATLLEFQHRMGTETVTSFAVTDRAGFLAAASEAGIDVREPGGA